jgi:hypothetical protein
MKGRLPLLISLRKNRPCPSRCATLSSPSIPERSAARTGHPQGFLVADWLMTTLWATTTAHPDLPCPETFALYNPHTTE